jgi:hypothetical protein
MKTFLLATALLAASLPGVAANVDVGVSIGISQPGVYGRIDIGRFPQPQVIVQQPVIVGRPILRPVQPVQPVYLWVPVVQQQHWGRHCGRYGACGVPVYFVQDRWYRDHVVDGRRYEQRHDRRDGRGDGYRYDRRDDDRDDRRHDGGRGNGPGNGQGGYLYR